MECDASIMNSNGGFGAVGAVPDIANPIQVAWLFHVRRLFSNPLVFQKVAKAILKQERKGLFSHGRIPPLLLCGEGALHWATSVGLPVSSLVTPSQVHPLERAPLYFFILEN